MDVKLKKKRLVKTSSTEVQILSFRVVSQRTTKKWIKRKNTRTRLAERAEIFVWLIKYANLWRSHCRCLRHCICYALIAWFFRFQPPAATESLRVRHISDMCLSVPSLSTERKETGNTSSFLHSSILLLKTGPRNFFAKQASKSVLHNMRNDKGLLASSLPIALFSWIQSNQRRLDNKLGIKK